MTGFTKTVTGVLAPSGVAPRRTSRKLTAALAVAGLWDRAITFVMMLARIDEEARIQGATAYATYLTATTGCYH